ncbi:protein PYRICULARIA ORYZAE RESISTANCE 21-like [Ziziphus jujuba]|uniref:Protein PYRICULARIA ORYZAE RESISTANCE 21-like n=1 Tax=Ziziphus jujuba TaxID=326968 RepID=A0A6P3ZL79_ZIZJJ|nr:protein PYRICULARIA ORYZAE RESISTANCE 21-like [Ziziphus jujuba]
MGSEKVTMVLSVDLKCSKCFKKVKKILCKFPEIQDQEYDEKNGKVTIKVVSCNPEKIKEKILCKGGGCITKIEIKVLPVTKPQTPPPKPPPPPPPQPPPPPPPQPPAQSIAIGVCCQQPFGGYYPCCRGCGGQCCGNCGRRGQCGGQCEGSCCGRRSGGQCEGSCCGRRCGGQCDGDCRKQCCANQCNAPFWCEENPKGGCTTM